LAWACEDFACVIFNLHTEHYKAGITRSAAAFMALIDEALVLGGSFFSPITAGPLVLRSSGPTRSSPSFSA
jgi:hypothetical protein